MEPSTRTDLRILKIFKRYKISLTRTYFSTFALFLVFVILVSLIVFFGPISFRLEPCECSQFSYISHFNFCSHSTDKKVNFVAFLTMKSVMPESTHFGYRLMLPLLHWKGFVINWHILRCILCLPAVVSNDTLSPVYPVPVYNLTAPPASSNDNQTYNATAAVPATEPAPVPTAAVTAPTQPVYNATAAPVEVPTASG